MADPGVDRIAAIATAPGTGALSVVRLSGPGVRGLLLKVFKPDGAAVWEERAIRHGLIAIGEEPVDDGLAWWAKGPSTFTGEDVAEFSGHGGILITARVLDSFLAAGARLAEPGEFTRRAFLNGRMDLARAEAVADVISASTDDALRVARSQLSGGLSARIMAIRDELVDVLAHVEASVDFPDEDLHPDGNIALAGRIDAMLADCRALAATFRVGRLYREGARVVLCGRPNVGKSSLLNALARRERSIVSAEPGTTRDVIEESVDLGGFPVILVDTAGLREAGGDAEAEGVRRAREAAATADLVVFVYDGARGFGGDDLEVFGQIGGAPAITVANKADLGQAVSEAPEGRGLAVSARTRSGVSALAEEIGRRLRAVPSAEAGTVVVTRARHREALESAGGLLERGALAVRGGSSPDLVASDLRRALDSLGQIVGVVTTEDLLGAIFSRFCVGK